MDGGVIDEDIGPSELVANPSPHCGHAGFVADIELHGMNPAPCSTKRPRGMLALGQIAGSEHHLEPAPHQLTGNFVADAPVGPGHHRHR